MKRVNNRQYKLTQIKPKRYFIKANINPVRKKISNGVKIKKGRRYDSKLDRRGR